MNLEWNCKCEQQLSYIPGKKDKKDKKDERFESVHFQDVQDIYWQ